ncbi:MAG: hypothetical protein IPK63_19950 [Candidatus Competibacteraceae bacterium]|nr:hypothetical protein [Candidatus Competibacteraceae bacterium]
MFVLLGWGGAKAISSHGASRGVARGFGLALFSVPLCLLYLSSLSGFYEVRLSSKEVTLKYLLPFATEKFPITDVLGVREKFAFKNSWRVQITTQGEVEHSSALTGKEGVSGAIRMIEKHLGSTRGK